MNEIEKVAPTLNYDELLEVLISYKNGDFSKRMPHNLTGIEGKVADLINEIVLQSENYFGKIEKVTNAVVEEGKFETQLNIDSINGQWESGFDKINSIISNLSKPILEISQIMKLIYNGELTESIEMNQNGKILKGEYLKLSKNINKTLEKLNVFSKEVIRVAGEVGIEGKLGGKVEVENLAGAWKEITDNVNSMAKNITSQVRNIAEVTTSVANGDLGKKIEGEFKGEIQEMKLIINKMVDQLNSFASEVTRVAKEVGTDGKLGGQANVKGVSGIWKDLTENVNSMANNLTSQVRNIAEVTTSVAKGDLTTKITVETKGEMLELKNTVNTMVDQLNSFASEVTRVAKEVGTDGILGGQADVEGVSGTWKDLTNSVNSMANNLTSQVRNIAEVTTAVANGDLKKQITVETKGEMLELKSTVNTMVDQLNSFASEVTRVAKEVGTDGKLGGQANVPGASGIWRDLTDNVNQLAGNLTTQVRAISEVATAVASGDHSRTISVLARGEVAELKDNVNQMIANLKKTTSINTEQDWLKTNLTKFTRNLQGQKELVTVSKLILSDLAKLISIQNGAFYLVENDENEVMLKLISSYAYNSRKHLSNKYKLGESLIGQVVLEREKIIISEVPDDYITISSGLGEAKPYNILVVPIIFENEVKAVMELASFNKFKDIHIGFIDQLTESIGIVINTIQATMKTEELLEQSQSLTEKLKMQQEELQKTNEELEEKAGLLEKQNREVEIKNNEVEKKNDEVELAKISLEEKAKQLALTSKYKSQFLANMSHELRTPLNSLLMLSEILSQNKENNLNSKQVEFANTILNSGKDLLTLINDILDLSKIESGTVYLDLSRISLNKIKEFIYQIFGEIAKNKNLDFNIIVSRNIPADIFTDSNKLKQILKNLLSNAFKFTKDGEVKLEIKEAKLGWNLTNNILNNAGSVIVFEVSDTGIGIPKNKQGIVFEAFQQVDGSTSRKYGGTGLGLSICRELANLLGGEITLESEEGKGSSFKLFLPISIENKNMSRFIGNDENLQKINENQDKKYLATENIIEIQAEERIPNFLDDRNEINQGDSIILIIDDDVTFGKIIADNARESGFKILYASKGSTGYELAEKYLPDAVILDINLPDANGVTILDMMKQNLKTRHIPVHIISIERTSMKSLQLGALSFIEKPVKPEDVENLFENIREYIGRKVKKLLVVEQNELQIEVIKETIGNNDVVYTFVKTGVEAIEKLETEKFDCILLDFKLPNVDGMKLIKAISENKILQRIPTIISIAKDITENQKLELKKYAKSIILKEVNSKEQLIDETSLFLHRICENLSEEKRNVIKNSIQFDSSLKGKKILLIDDDLRNIYAISGALEEYGIDVLHKEEAIAGIQLLKNTPDIDLVLMDIMLPEMDGYEAIKIIRQIDEFRELPIVALTAKAMLGDKEKCINAGASDYISKPVSIKQLISLIRVWLY